MDQNGALYDASLVNAGGSDFGYFTLSSDGGYGIFLGGFMDFAAGTQKNGLVGYTPASSPCSGALECTTGQPAYTVDVQSVSMNALSLNPVVPPVTDSSITDTSDNPTFIRHCHTGFKPASNTAATQAASATMENMDIYPNPTTGISNISIAIEKNTHVDIKLTNSIGQDVSNVIQQYERDAHEGNYNVAISSDKLPPGVYYCTVSLNGQTTTKKLVVY